MDVTYCRSSKETFLVSRGISMHCDSTICKYFNPSRCLAKKKKFFFFTIAYHIFGTQRYVTLIFWIVCGLISQHFQDEALHAVRSCMNLHKPSRWMLLTPVSNNQWSTCLSPEILQPRPTTGPVRSSHVLCQLLITISSDKGGEKKIHYEIRLSVF